MVQPAELAALRWVTTEPKPLMLVLFNEIAAVGIACFIPVNAAAAVSELPPARLSVGGAVNNTSRQVGSVLGIALLVSVIGTASDPAGMLDGHRNGWMLVGIAAVVSALISTRQPQARKRPVAVVAEPEVVSPV